MKPFKFVHSADLHLDSPFSGIRAIDDQIASLLSDATFQTFENIVDLCIKNDVAFLLVAGDVYDSKDRSLRAQLRFRDGLTRLSQEGIWTFVVHGNHDPLDRPIATLQWPDKVRFFKGDEVDCVPVYSGDELIGNICGISYQTQDVRENLVSKFQKRADSPFSIGLLHCNVGSDTGHEPYAPCTMEDLKKTGMDYWALGHVHNYRVISSENPTVIYAGNPQGRNFSELGPRGCFLVNVDEDGNCVHEFTPVDTIRWFLNTIDIVGIDDDESLVRQVQDACNSIRKQSERHPAICRIELTGRGLAHRSLTNPQFVVDLIQRLRDIEVGEEPFVWVEGIEVRTRLPIDIEAIKKGEGFEADLLKLVSERREDTAYLMSLRNELSQLFGSRQGLNFLNPLTDDDLLSFLNNAEARCLDLLIEEQD